MDKVSIIVPIYNVEKYLSQCLDSIHNQNYKNIEVILVNDGSTDTSKEICEEYCKKYKEFILYNKENGGLSSARNYGLDRITGDYITFVDSDDLINKNYISDLYNTIIETKCDVSMCGYKRFNSELPNLNITNKIEKFTSNETLEKILYQENQEFFSVSSCTKMYKKDIFEKIRFPENRINEDVAIIEEVFKKCQMISCIFNYDYYYRYNPTSITGQSFNPKKMDIIYFTERMIKDYSNTSLKLAAINLFFRRNIEIISIISKKDENKEYRKVLINNIKKYRKDVLKDKKSKKTTKFAAIGSYFSINLVVFFRNLLKNN